MIERRRSPCCIKSTRRGDTLQSEDLPAKLGMVTANTGMFEMTDHPVPLENMLGREGDGFRVAMQSPFPGGQRARGPPA